eukprot:312912-Prymnesium_polylepis.1
MRLKVENDPRVVRNDHRVAHTSLVVQPTVVGDVSEPRRRVREVCLAARFALAHVRDGRAHPLRVAM